MEDPTPTKKGCTLTWSLGLVIVAMMFLAAIALPKMGLARAATNEATAISTCRTLLAAQGLYHKVHDRYTGSFQALLREGLIDEILADGTRSGFTFSLTGAESTCTVTAVPVEYGKSGTRSFFVDQSGILRHNPGPTADVSSDPVE